MKKFSNKLLAALLATASVLNLSLSASAFNSNKTNSIFIESQGVPSGATAYARDIFAHLDVEDLNFLGFSYSVAENMKLAPGFNATSYSSDAKNCNVYYFPVMNNNEVVALFTLTEANGEYSYSFGKSELADSLNSLKTSASNAAEIVVTDGAFYGVTNGDIITLSVLPDADLSGDKDILEGIEISSAETSNWLSNDNSAVIEISADTVYNETAIKTASSSGTRGYMGKKRYVPIVDNWTYYEGSTLRGTCWASCTGSLIEYYINGSNSTDANGAAWRNTVRDDRYQTTGAYSGGISTAKSYIESNVSGASMSTTGSSLSWANVRTNILTNNAPCYTRWQNSSSSVGHAMVLCGYRYNADDPDNTSYHGLYFMDPNKTSYQLISFGSTYTINGNSYSWVNTLIKN